MEEVLPHLQFVLQNKPTHTPSGKVVYCTAMCLKVWKVHYAIAATLKPKSGRLKKQTRWSISGTSVCSVHTHTRTMTLNESGVGSRCEQGLRYIMCFCRTSETKPLWQKRSLCPGGARFQQQSCRLRNVRGAFVSRQVNTLRHSGQRHLSLVIGWKMEGSQSTCSMQIFLKHSRQNMFFLLLLFFISVLYVVSNVLFSAQILID